MDKQFVSVSMVHEFTLNRLPSNKSLEDRLILQKLIYLAKHLGIDCGDFRFSWYKKGPYSPALTRVIYNNIAELENSDIQKNYVLLESAKKELIPLREIFKENTTKLSEADWIELLGSIVYLIDINKNIAIASNELVQKKPKNNLEDVELAVNQLEKFNII